MSLGTAPLAADFGAEHFARYGYVTIPALIEPALTDFLRSYIHTKLVSGLMPKGDPFVPNAPACYGDGATDALLEHLKARVQAYAGCRLTPTYSFMRIYRQGDELTPHRDRAACEFSVSLNIRQVPDDPWALFVEDTDGRPAEVLLRPGDALLYRGPDLTHWREPYTGQQLVQVFLHYVATDGPNAGEKFDGRPSLMRPKASATRPANA